MQTPSPVQGLNFTQLLRATEGLTQTRPVLLGFLSMLAAGVVVGLGGFLSASLSGMFGTIVGVGLSGLLGGLLFAAGMSGVGILLMDKARNIEPRSLVDAWLAGLFCIPKLIGFGVVIFLAMAALAVVAGLVYLVCKIPVLGPVLLFFAHPAMVVVASLVFTALFWVAFPLFAPAIWEGRGFKEALSVVATVARNRLLPTIVQFVLLYLLMSLISMLMVAAIFPGFTLMSGIASSVLNIRMGLGGLTSGYGMDANLVAGMLATMVIFGLAFVLLMQVALMGVNLVYLSVTENLDTSSTEQALAAGLAQAKEKARQAQEKARQAAEVAQEKARQAAEQAKERARQRAEEQAAAQALAAERAAAQAAALEQAAAEEEAAQKAAEAQAAEEAAAAQALAQARAAEQAAIAQAAQERAAAEKAQAQAAQQAVEETAPVSPTPAAAPSCPQCQHPVGANDMFCGECGQRLKG